MSKVLAVAWREFKHTALTKAFIFGAVIVPLAIMGVMFLAPALFKPNITPLTGTIAVVDEDGAVAAAAEVELDPERFDERVAAMLAQFGEGAAEAIRAAGVEFPEVRLTIEHVEPSASLEALKDRVVNGDLQAVCIYPASLAGNGRAGTNDDADTIALYFAEGVTPNHTDLIANALRTAVVRARVERTGQGYDDLRSLLKRPSTETRTLTDEGDEAAFAGELGMLIPGAFMLLLWISTITSANHLLTTTIEEKSNKVIEVLLSAVSPMQLMTGKILGQALVSLVMLVMYAGLGIMALVAFSFMHLLPWTHLLYLALYFVMAYFMIASVMAGIGAAVNEMREAQSLIGPAMLVLIVPFMLWFPIQETPNGTLATVTSFIPPMTPFVMILRVTSLSEAVPTWQTIASLIWGYLCMIAMIWMAARIFRVGVLMYGKPPSPLELIKWLRYS